MRISSSLFILIFLIISPVSFALEPLEQILPEESGSDLLAQVQQIESDTEINLWLRYSTNVPGFEMKISNGQSSNLGPLGPQEGLYGRFDQLLRSNVGLQGLSTLFPSIQSLEIESIASSLRSTAPEMLIKIERDEDMWYVSRLRIGIRRFTDEGIYRESLEMSDGVVMSHEARLPSGAELEWFYENNELTKYQYLEWQQGLPFLLSTFDMEGHLISQEQYEYRRDNLLAKQNIWTEDEEDKFIRYSYTLTENPQVIREEIRQGDRLEVIAYDSFGNESERKRFIKSQLESEEQWEYNNQGRLLSYSLESEDQQISEVYDANQNIVQRRVWNGGVLELNASYEYNLENQIILMRESRPGLLRVIRHSYENDKLSLTIQEDNGFLSKKSFYSAGELVKEEQYISGDLYLIRFYENDILQREQEFFEGTIIRDQVY